MLTPRQAVLVLVPQGRSAAAQALLLRQATTSPGIVQTMQAFMPRQAAPTLFPSCWEGVQAVQTLFPRQTAVSVPAKVTLVLWGMLLLPWTIHVSWGKKGRDLEDRHPRSPARTGPVYTFYEFLLQSGGKNHRRSQS